MPQFNDAQTRAISARNPSILVSAAAGSGKTTVMVEKIRQTLISDPEASISQFLVITFTRDAARNMKDKLRALLEDAAQQGIGAAAKALGEIETACVSTIHAFCAQLLREYNDDAGASMNPRVLKETEIRRMLDECFSDAVEALLGRDSALEAEDKSAVGEFLTSFGPEEARGMTEELYGVLMGIPSPFDFLERAAKAPPTRAWDREILDAADLDILSLEECLRREEELWGHALAIPQYEDILRRDGEIVEALLRDLERAGEGRNRARGDAAEDPRKNTCGETTEDPQKDSLKEKTEDPQKNTCGEAAECPQKNTRKEKTEDPQKDTREEAAEKIRLLEAAKSAFPKAPSVRGLDEDAKEWKLRMDKVRNDMKGSDGIIANALRRLAPVTDEKSVLANAVIRRELRALELLLRETASRYRKQKLEAGAIDYADMEQTAYRIMSDPDKRDELLARYKYVYVDECQDVSGIQDAIIKSLAAPDHHFFMVGDIKQSIYGFRHAEPELFERERRAYSDDAASEERRIFFTDNYRSCQSVVDAVNEVFSEAMDRRITDLDYLPEDRLRCNVKGDFGPVDVILVSKGDEEADRLEAQCEAVGRYIHSLISPAPEAGARESFRFGDIVILLRNSANAASVIVDHLKKMHIPAMYEGAPDFFGLAEVKSFLSLLTVIDNRRNDDALVGALINPPFLFTDRDLADIRLEKPEHVPFYRAFEMCAERREKPIDGKCREAAELLASWAEKAENMSVPDFVWWLMRETGIYASRGAYPDGKARQANLDALHQRAVDGMKAGNMRLSDFISDLREARETRQSDSDDHPIPGADDNFVRVMTMHKSKGLEFPAVILMNLQRNIHKSGGTETLLTDVGSSGDELGFYLPAVQRRRSSRADSQGKDAFAAKAYRKRISEETRVLYVAMTRAEKRLCLTGSFKDGDDALWRAGIRTARVWRTKTMLDMLMPAVLKRVPLPSVGETGQDALWRVTMVSGRAIGESAQSVSAAEPFIQRVLSSREPTLMYTPERAESAPLKTSVTTLTRSAPVISDEDSEETVEDKRKTEEAVRTFRLGSVPSKPAFLEEEKVEAVSVGTATHRFLRLIDLDAFRDEHADVEAAVYREAERMKAEGVMTPEEAGLVRLRGVAAFLRGALGQRMLKSADVRREAGFTMRIDPHAPTMVQGIVDCAFMEDGQWVLIDYKTDRDTDPETFVPRHEAQMNWYREAMERLTRLSVKEMWLFALRAGEAYRVERRGVTGRPDPV